MALPDEPKTLDGRILHALRGTSKCACYTPSKPGRVWYQRTMTGGPTIYLMPDTPSKPVRVRYADHSFGWVDAPNTWLAGQEGWCNFWPAHSDVDILLANLHDTGHCEWIEFTDQRTFQLARASQSAREDLMHNYAKETDYKRQAQPWMTPAHIALAIKEIPQGPEMGNFDPYAAAADQAVRLNKGQKVSNLQAKCASAVDSVVSNNKTAAKAAAYLEAGRIANNQFAKMAAKSLPALMRGYADTPVGKLVIANLAMTAAQHFKPGNTQLARLTDAMAAQAYADIYANFKIEEMIDNFLADSKIQDALTKVSD